MDRIRNPAAVVFALTLLAASILLLRPLFRRLIRRYKVRIVAEALHRRPSNGRCPLSSSSSRGLCGKKGAKSSNNTGHEHHHRGETAAPLFDPRRRPVDPDLVRDLLEKAALAARAGGPPSVLDPLSERSSAASFVVTSERDRLDELADIYTASATASSSGLSSSHADSGGIIPPDLHCATDDSARLIRSCSAVVTFSIDLAPLKRWFDLGGGMRSAELAGFGSDLGNAAAYMAALGEAQRAAENFATLCHAGGLVGGYLGGLSEVGTAGRDGEAAPAVRHVSSSPGGFRKNDDNASKSPSDRLHDFLGLPPKLSVVVASYAVGWPSSTRLCCGAWGGGLRCLRSGGGGKIDDDDKVLLGSTNHDSMTSSASAPSQEPQPQPARIFDEKYGTMTAVEVLEHHECLDAGWKEREERRWRKASRRRALEATRKGSSSSGDDGIGSRSRSGSAKRHAEQGGSLRLSGLSSINDDANMVTVLDGDDDLFQDNDVDANFNIDVESNSPSPQVMLSPNDSPTTEMPHTADDLQRSAMEGVLDDKDYGDGGFHSFLASHSIESAAQYLCLAGGFAGRDLRMSSHSHLEGAARRGFALARGVSVSRRGTSSGHRQPRSERDDRHPCDACGRISHVHDAATVGAPASSFAASAASSPTHGHPCRGAGCERPYQHTGRLAPSSATAGACNHCYSTNNSADAATELVLKHDGDSSRDCYNSDNGGDDEDTALGRSISSLAPSTAPSYNPAGGSTSTGAAAARTSSWMRTSGGSGSGGGGGSSSAATPIPQDSLDAMEMQQNHSLAA